jgi:DNA-binding beta-propeller fold protein YncE
MQIWPVPLSFVFTACLWLPAAAELPAILTYETKPDAPERREGLVIMELDMSSPDFGKILHEIPLPPDLVAHHVYINPEVTKAYITALGRSELRVMDLDSLEVKTVDVPDCQVGENVAFSEKTGLWYLTCMGSSTMIVGDGTTDAPLRTVRTQAPYPHGIAVHDGIDRILLTSTVRPSDLGDPGEVIQELELSTERPVTTHHISNKPSPAASAPVEVVFIPNADPPMAYTTGMFEGTLWLGAWQPESESMTWSQVIDFAALGQNLPLEIYYNETGDRAFVSTANPGHLNIFDITDPAQPQLLQSVPTAGGAHHMVFSADGKLAYVQNSFLNLPEMHDGSISVVDIEKGAVIESIDTLKNAGLTPNNIILMSGGHAH